MVFDCCLVLLVLVVLVVVVVMVGQHLVACLRTKSVSTILVSVAASVCAFRFDIARKQQASI